MAKSDKPSDLALKSRYFASILRNIVPNNPAKELVEHSQRMVEKIGGNECGKRFTKAEWKGDMGFLASCQTCMWRTCGRRLAILTPVW